MSKEFIEGRHGSASIEEAKRQQAQLSYFTQSKTQETISNTFWANWDTSKIPNDDHFMVFICSILKADNFQKFAKHIRYPLPTTRIINNKIKQDLSRVYYSEDAYFRYKINNKDVGEIEELNSQKFTNDLFEKIFYNHNDIIIHDLSDVNKPYRYFLSIYDVIAIDSEENTIEKIAFSACINDDTENEIEGFMYMDDMAYIFYDKEFKNEPIVTPHDIGRCPASYISNRMFKNDDVVRASIFSDVRELMERYLMLYVMQSMTEPNGVIPTITKLATTEVKKSQDASQMDYDEGAANNMSATLITKGKRKEKEGDKVLEFGTVINAPVVKKQDGSIDMDMVTNFIKYNYLPVEAMQQLNDRVDQLKKELIIALTGDYAEQNQEAVNELQNMKSYISKQDKLRDISQIMTFARNESDWIFLALKHGKDNVKIDGFYGSDFFLETQDEIYKLLKESPNPIESKSLLIRLAKNKSRFNKDKGRKEEILYKLLPYAVQTDFQSALEVNAVDTITFQYQTRFNYWINLFESQYGSILEFWDMMENAKESEKIITINNFIVQLIKNNEQIYSAYKMLPSNGVGDIPIKG